MRSRATDAELHVLQQVGSFDVAGEHDGQLHLGDELGVGTVALPGGENPLRLLVIVGKS